MIPSIQSGSPQFHEDKIAQKWQKTHFDQSLLDTDYDGVEFAVKTGLIHTIGMYQESSSSLDGPAMTIENINGKAHVLKEGVLTPLSQIQAEISYTTYNDGSFEKFDGWSFVR